MQLQSCEYCNTIADKFCDECQAPFCSVECIADNVEHRQRCKNSHARIYEIKETVVNEAGNPIPVKPQAIPIGSNVMITCAINHKILFVRPTDLESDAEYIGLMNDIAQYTLTADKLAALPEPGDWVLAKWQNITCRALVLKVTIDKEIVCGFIDFGNVEKCSLDDLKVISDVLKRRPWTVNKIALDGVPNACVFEDVLKIIYLKMCKHEKFALIKTHTGYDLLRAKIYSLTAELNETHDRLIKNTTKEPQFIDVSSISVLNPNVA